PPVGEGEDPREGPRLAQADAPAGRGDPPDPGGRGRPRDRAEGSGKTEAALLPVLDRLAKEERQGIGLLYITPLRALNRDMQGRLQRLCGSLGLDVEIRHGDTPQKDRRRQSAKPPDVLITTPESR